ncbi:hypothetical protein [Brumimicrobium mesophilum]|uniref:hypothetical protein n=1 Tax=Brumimicrobium mesophilum TaxID=392717 RepID=UPI000D1421AE|nr:hypothetical protein [Brumimicrobium mesophilum]
MKIPNISLTNLSGNKHILSDLIKSDKLNLILFYNSNCLGCTGRAIPLAYNLLKQHSFIALSVIHSNFGKKLVTQEEILSIFTEQYSPIEIYKEDHHKLYDFFNCEGTPHWILMNGKSDILYSFFGSQDGTQMKLQYAIDEYSLN